jgi:hypothetical protein
MNENENDEYFFLAEPSKLMQGKAERRKAMNS